MKQTSILPSQSLSDRCFKGTLEINLSRLKQFSAEVINIHSIFEGIGTKFFHPKRILFNTTSTVVSIFLTKTTTKFNLPPNAIRMCFIGLRSDEVADLPYLVHYRRLTKTS